MKKSILTLIVVVAVLIIGGLSYYYSTSTSSSSSSTQLNGNTASSTSSEPARVINVDASRFTYSPDVIKVKKGEHVKIVINNLDTTHGITIPDLGVSGIGSVEFTADKAGTFPFRCPTYCGDGHREMTGTLIVE